MRCLGQRIRLLRSETDVSTSAHDFAASHYSEEIADRMQRKTGRGLPGSGEKMQRNSLHLLELARNPSSMSLRHVLRPTIAILRCAKEHSRLRWKAPIIVVNHESETGVACYQSSVRLREKTRRWLPDRKMQQQLLGMRLWIDDQRFVSERYVLRFGYRSMRSEGRSALVRWCPTDRRPGSVHQTISINDECDLIVTTCRIFQICVVMFCSVFSLPS